MRCFRAPFFRRKWITALGADFVIQNAPSLSLSPLFHAAEAAGSGAFALWLLSSEDSCLAVRQGCSAVLHTCRLVHSAAFSLLDAAGSQAISYALPGAAVFSPRRAAARGARRLMRALRANGGVYDDLGSIVHIVANGLRAVLPSEILSAVNAFPPARPALVADSRDLVLRLLKEECGVRPCLISPLGIRHGPFVTHTITLTNNRTLTVTAVDPRVARMRRFDLVPFRAAAALARMFSETSALVDALVDRLDVTIAREIAARKRIFAALSVDPLAEGQAQARWRHFALCVPPPLPELSSEHVMTTEGVLGAWGSVSPQLTREIIRGSAELMFAHALIIPDLSPWNLCRYDQRPSLLRFGPLLEFDPGALHRGLNLAIANAGRDPGDVDKGLVIQALSENALFVVGAAEAIAGANVMREKANLRIMSLEPYVGGVIGKTWSKKGHQNNFPACLLGWTRWLPF
jgi:hypothetical protein